MHVHRFVVGPLDNNTYVVVDDVAEQAVVIDPSFESDAVLAAIEHAGWRVTAVLNTHAHIDHVAENARFVESLRAPLYVHAADVKLLDAMPQQAAWMGVDPPRACGPPRPLRDGQTVPVGSETLEVAHTPGHSPGSVSFLGPGFAIVGDALFAGSIGRTDLPGGDMRLLLESIQGRLLTLPDDTIVYPGHGPETTIGQERRSNPFLVGLAR